MNLIGAQITNSFPSRAANTTQQNTGGINRARLRTTVGMAFGTARFRRIRHERSPQSGIIDLAYIMDGIRCSATTAGLQNH